MDLQMDLMWRVSPPLTAALVLTGLWGALTPAPSHTPPPTPTAAIDPLVALRQDEARWRQVLSARLAKGGPLAVRSGSNPSFLATDDDAVFVVGAGGATWRLPRGDWRPRRIEAMPSSATPSPRLAGVQGENASDGDNHDARHDVVVARGGLQLRAQRLSRRVSVTTSLGAVAHADKVGALFSADIVDGEAGVVVVTGIEDAALDRSQGAFFNIDSSAELLRLAGTPPQLSVVQRLNLSALGVVTPKAVAVFGDAAAGLVVAVAGAGSGAIAIFDVRVRDDVDGDADVLALRAVVDGLLGQNDIVFVDGDHVAVASPLADAVAIVDINTDDRIVIDIIDDDVADASALARLGEALLMTTALAPEQSSEGPLSRFSCEACHPDGGVDGRVHETGRADDGGHPVVASTKPLWGLFQNPPLFSRAYDDSVSAMVHAEVGVANAKTHRGPWTPLFIPIDAPLLRDVVSADEVADVVSPVLQRRAMLDAFATTLLTPPALATTSARTPPTEAQWRVFARRCLGCHQARVYSDDASSVADDDFVAARRWDGVFSWASEARVDVGVRPAVREGGARVSSLRAISHKRPLLSNGGAPTLQALLAQMRVDDDDSKLVWHDGTPKNSTPLTADEQAALLAVLQAL